MYGEGLKHSTGLQNTLFVPPCPEAPPRGGAFVLPALRGAPARDCLLTMPDVTVVRRLRFNAAHRVHNPALSEEENAQLFGKCNNPNWHGHNYTLDVHVTGPVDSRTGYVIDLGVLRDTVERLVINEADHRNFNIDVPFMHGVIPTTENLVVQMWRLLEPQVAPGRLSRLRLWETENNYVEYEGR